MGDEERLAVIKLNWDKPYGRTLGDVINECKILDITTYGDVKDSLNLTESALYNFINSSFNICDDIVYVIINHKNISYSKGLMKNLKTYERKN